ncbi:MAG: cation transporter [Clostridia bacterium]|nr:cation transporter [Clostridia bacterium]
MQKILVKLFIRDPENTSNLKVREAYGTLGSITGIVVNLILAIIKYIAGVLSGSISVTADAINNLSDAGSSIISLIGVKLSAMPADKDHPYGHGRVEYISALGVSFFVLLMGIELFKSSVDKIVNPAPVKFNWIALIILLVSILMKLWLGYFNKKLGEKINSAPMIAVMKDSFSDCLATSVALVAIIVSAFSDISIDGYLGIIVAGFIFLAGFNILKDTMADLLGKPADKEFTEQIEKKIMSYDKIVGVHDMIVHDYGPGRRFASAHAEVSSRDDIMEIHDIIDLAERDIFNEFGLIISIHTDPIVTDDERINSLKDMTKSIVQEISNEMSIHDFRVVDGPTHTNLIFDLIVPHKYHLSNNQIIQIIEDKLSKIDERYFVVITIEHAFN